MNSFYIYKEYLSLCKRGDRNEIQRTLFKYEFILLSDITFLLPLTCLSGRVQTENLPSCGLFEFFCHVIFSSSVLRHFGALLLKCLSRCGLWEHGTITFNEKLEEFLSAECCWTLILHFFIVPGCDCGLIDGGHQRSACLKSCIVLVSGVSEHCHLTWVRTFVTETRWFVKVFFSKAFAFSAAPFLCWVNVYLPSRLLSYDY